MTTPALNTAPDMTFRRRPDVRTAYNTRDIGAAFDAALVLFLIANLRAALADPARALAKHDAEVWDEVLRRLQEAGHTSGALYVVRQMRADRIEAQP